MATEKKRPYVRIGLNTAVLPVEITVADEMTHDTEMRVVLFQADRWDTLRQVLNAFKTELDGAIEDVEHEERMLLE